LSRLPLHPAAAPAAPAAAPAGATGAAPPADPGNLVAGAKAPEATPPTLDAVKAFLTEKGAKPEELAALDEAGLRAKYAEAQKPAGEKTTAPKAEDFAVKAPEGTTVDEVAVKAFQETLADANLSPAERAQRLFDQHQAALKAATEAPVQLWLKTQTEWVAAVKADAELGRRMALRAPLRLHGRLRPRARRHHRRHRDHLRRLGETRRR
jgi:hypothetical protein